MFCRASTRYYLYAKNKIKIKILYGGKVMAPFEKKPKIKNVSQVYLKAGVEPVLGST